MFTQTLPGELRSRLVSAQPAALERVRRSSSIAALRNPKRLRTEVFAGLVTALALIPETISFSIVAGVGPAVGLFTSFIFAITVTFVGGRPAMISAAAGSIALVVAPLVRDHGVDYLVAAVLLGGALQILLAVAGVARLMRFIPQSVLTGFVNALAILIFIAQLPHLIGVPWLVYPMTAVGLVVMVVMPRLTQAVPAPLVATVILTACAILLTLDVPRVGDQGSVSGLPGLGLPSIPLELGVLGVILPYAIAIALIGLLESLITAKLVDEYTETSSDPRREGWGQGVANVVTGFFGGMGGCAMIGQTMMNVKTCGGRTRLSTLVAGLTLLCMMAFFSPLLAAIPMAALVAVMIMVSVATMDWQSISLRALRRMPVAETLTMLGSVVVTVVTHNLAYGVIAGTLCAMVLFVCRLAGRVEVSALPCGPDPEHRTYQVSGHLFFASSNALAEHFDYAAETPAVTIDFSGAHLWDATSIAVLDRIRSKFQQHGTSVRFTGLNEQSEQLRARLSQSG